MDERDRKDCIFCRLDREILVENELAVAVYDRFPVSPGHSLVLPRRHATMIWDLAQDEYDSYVPGVKGLLRTRGSDPTLARRLSAHLREIEIDRFAPRPLEGDPGALWATWQRTVLPDVLANAGGVVVSCFEWVQDLQNFFWEENEVNTKLSRIMRHSFSAVE